RGLFIVRKNASLGLTDFEDTSLRMSPNPAKSIVNIAFDSELESIEIFNVLGEQVRTFKGALGTEYSIDVEGLSAGLYLVKINNVVTKKLIIK
ncbi:MAG TPA: T9SS type A sorting domain-containing protein, partial [Flavobacterium sp.]